MCTGNESLNFMLGGGLRRGEVTQIYGPSGSGKSGTIGQILGHIADQSLGTCALIDADHTAENAVAFYGPLSDLQKGVIIHEPATAEEAKVVAVALTDCTDVVVVDSLGAFHPEDHGDTCPGSLIIRLSAAAYLSGAIVIVTNQVRVDIRRGGRKTAYGGISVKMHSGTIISLESKPLRKKGVRRGITVAAHREKFKGKGGHPFGFWDLEYIE